MAVAIIEGVFMGVNLHESNFDGNKKVSVLVDIYQPTSTDRDKTVTVRADNLEYLSTFNQGYSMGDVVKVKCRVSAYKNDPKYALIDIA